LLVRGLSVRTGATGDHRGRLVWADIAWNGLNAPARAPSQDPYEAAIRDGQTALARRSADVPAWFGRSTLARWALAGPDELVTAPSARELADLLYRLLDVAAPPQRGAAGCVRQVAAKRNEPPCVRSASRPAPSQQQPAPGKPRQQLRLLRRLCNAARRPAPARIAA
jgi:hypothetical protein